VKAGHVAREELLEILEGLRKMCADLGIEYGLE